MDLGGVMQVTVDIQPGPELDAEVGERLTRQLRRELLELDVESVALLPPDRAAPEGRSATRSQWALSSLL